jgi:hypothetical protein
MLKNSIMLFENDIQAVKQGNCFRERKSSFMEFVSAGIDGIIDCNSEICTG